MSGSSVMADRSFTLSSGVQLYSDKHEMAEVAKSLRYILDVCLLIYQGFTVIFGLTHLDLCFFWGRFGL